MHLWLLLCQLKYLQLTGDGKHHQMQMLFHRTQAEESVIFVKENVSASTVLQG